MDLVWAFWRKPTTALFFLPGCRRSAKCLHATPRWNSAHSGDICRLNVAGDILPANVAGDSIKLLD